MTGSSAVTMPVDPGPGRASSVKDKAITFKGSDKVSYRSVAKQVS
jgi:hypothetical protein